MCCIKSLIIIIILLPLFSVAQSRSAIEQYHVVGNNHEYVPISRAHFQNNKNWYAEGRYNYEDLKTFSLYFGKTFSWQQRLSYALTPIIGGAVGNFNGISAGLNMDLVYQNFFFSGQSQYSFSTDLRANNFFYNWSEVAYQPLKWLYGGITIQNTQLYKTEATFESGFLLGFSFKNISLPLYSFAPFNKDRYFMIGLTIEWERSKVKKEMKNSVAEIQ